jgi:hypothetical protein
VVAALAVAVVAPSAVTAEARHGFPKKCGDQNRAGAGWYNVESYKASCPLARGVARYWWNHGGDRRFFGWRCDDDRTGYETSRVDCKARHTRKGHVHVRFEAGA